MSTDATRLSSVYSEDTMGLSSRSKDAVGLSGRSKDSVGLSSRSTDAVKLSRVSTDATRLFSMYTEDTISLSRESAMDVGLSGVSMDAIVLPKVTSDIIVLPSVSGCYSTVQLVSRTVQCVYLDLIQIFSEGFLLLHFSIIMLQLSSKSMFFVLQFSVRLRGLYRVTSTYTIRDRCYRNVSSTRLSRTPLRVVVVRDRGVGGRGGARAPPPPNIFKIIKN